MIFAFLCHTLNLMILAVKAVAVERRESKILGEGLGKSARRRYNLDGLGQRH